MTTSETTIVLIRHGNTFTKEQTPVMIGRNEDLLLTDEGVLQARRLGVHLSAKGLVPAQVFCSPLQRATTTATEALCSANCQTPIQIREELSELDYGIWAGLRTDEVIEKFGEQALRRWEEEGTFPDGANFRPGPAEIKAGVRKILQEADQSARDGNGVAWIVSSNGILRFFLLDELVARTSRPPSLKMRTGGYSLLTEKSGVFSVVEWNHYPAIQ